MVVCKLILPYKVLYLWQHYSPRMQCTVNVKRSFWKWQLFLSKVHTFIHTFSAKKLYQFSFVKKQIVVKNYKTNFGHKKNCSKSKYLQCRMHDWDLIVYSLVHFNECFQVVEVKKTIQYLSRSYYQLWWYKIITFLISWNTMALIQSKYADE